MTKMKNQPPLPLNITMKPENSGNTVLFQKILFPYFLVLALLAISGFEYIYRADKYIVPVLLVLMWMLGDKSLRNKNVKRFLWLATPFWTQLILNNLLFQRYSVIANIVFFIFYFFLVQIVKKDFWRYYVNTLTFFAAISLLFYSLQITDNHHWILENISPYFESLNVDKSSDDFARMDGRYEYFRPNIMIYRFMIEDSIRNSGPFSEPGLFAGFLALALFIQCVVNAGSLFSPKSLLLTATILTTVSTTGYLMLMAIYLFYFTQGKNLLLKVIAIPAMVCIAAIAYTQLDFLGEKIHEQSQMVGTGEKEEYRMGAFSVHLEMISSSPLVGFDHNLYEQYTDALSLSNGITKVFVIHGIPVGFYYYFLLFFACRNMMVYHGGSKFTTYTFFLLLLCFAFAQSVTTRHFYYFLIFLGLLAYPHWKTQTGGLVARWRIARKHHLPYDYSTNNEYSE